MFRLGQFIITHEELGYELEAEIEQLDEEFEGTLIGKIRLMMFDEKDGNLIEQADKHSQYACDLVENVHIAEPYSSEWEKAVGFDFITLQRNNKTTYRDGTTHTLVTVCGRVAMISEVLLESTELESNIKEMIVTVIAKLQNLFHVDYLLANKEFFVPAEYQCSREFKFEKEEQANIAGLKATYKGNINTLKEIGFKKTGKDGYVLRIHECFLETV